jgi:hypothetical protein
MLDRRLVGWIAALSLVCALAPAQAPPFAFVKDQIPGESGPVLGLADFDQDGDLDLLTNHTGIYLNDGHGNFTPHPVLSAVSAGFGPQGTGFGQPVAIGDLNGDAYPDVIAWGTDNWSNTPSYVYKWINQGNGVLVSSPLVLATPTSSWPPRAFALGDVDLDGDRDVVVSYGIVYGANGYPQRLDLWLNDGAGSFTDASTLIPATPASPLQIVLRDLDADGDLDLVCGGESAGPGGNFIGPQILLNTGGGVFAAPVALAAPATHDCFGIGDFDGDGLPDLVFGASPRPSPCGPAGPLAVLRNTGGGTFAALGAAAAGTSRSVPQLLDIDADGKDEILVLAYGSSAVHPVGPTAVGAAIATIPVDIASCLSLGGVTGVDYAATGDLDGDADRDLVVFAAQRNRAFFNDSIGHLVAAPSSLEAPFGWDGPGTGMDPMDVDADGDVDLLLPSPACSGTGASQVGLRIALNDSTGSLTQAPPPPYVGPSPSAARAIFDADGDGDQDLCAGTDIAINTGGAFVVTQSIASPAVYAVKAADLDGDGDLDLVTTGATTTISATVIFLNDGTGTFQSTQTLPVAATCLAIADFDGDSDLDLMLGSGLYLNNGAGSFVQGPALPAVPYFYSLQAADFDGDGDVDLLLNGARLVNDGTGGFTVAAPLSPLPGYYQGWCAAIDVDLDGFPDIVSNAGLLYRNLGGTFATAVPLPSQLMAPIVHADFDGDGDEDLVARGPSILTNMTRQLSRGKPPRPGRPASLELAGPPGAPWLLFASYGTANLPVPGLGTVLLDLATAQLAYGGAMSPTGTATVSGTVPAGPAWVGTSVYWQAIVYHPQGARLTGLEVTTVANY